MNKLVPVILCGGSGTRLWPVSREVHPKPFIQLRDGLSLLQQTLVRALQLPGVTSVLTLTQEQIYFKARDEYAAVANGAGVELDFVLEPCARNTAPAIAMAAVRVMAQHGPEAVMLVMPADHLIEDQQQLTVAVAMAMTLAEEGQLVTFGIKPTHAETGYGYIQLGKKLHVAETTAVPEAKSDDKPAELPTRMPSAYKAKSFVEKPDRARAKNYVQSQCYLWNAGIFCFTAKTYLDALQVQAPDIYEAVTKCWARSVKGESPVKLDAKTFAAAPEVSVDYAVMEHAENVSVIACDFMWSDVGTWRAVCDLTAPGPQGNRVNGQAVLVDARNCYVQSPSRVVAAVGVSDLVIVDTPDALLVAHRDRVQDVRQVVKQLKSSANQAYRFHATVSRPWGTYTVLDEAEGFKVKRIVVKRGAALSLQMHHHRSEHWVVVRGTAKVVNGDSERLYHTNESIYVPPATPHRIINPGIIDLVIIEVQNGEYLGEDDIVRLQDQYGRA